MWEENLYFKTSNYIKALSVSWTCQTPSEYTKLLPPWFISTFVGQLQNIMASCVTSRDRGTRGFGPLNSWEVRELKGTVLNASIIWSTCAPHKNSGQFLLHCHRRLYPACWPGDSSSDCGNPHTVPALMLLSLFPLPWSASALAFVYSGINKTELTIPSFSWVKDC